MAKLNTNQAMALRDIVHDTNSTADIIDSCKNRMCVCDTEEELDHMFISMIQHVNKLYTQNKHRLYVKNTPDFDKSPTIIIMERITD